MHKKLYDFAISRGLQVANNYGQRTIAAYIELDSDGNFCDITVRTKEERRERVLCPQTPKNNTVSPICEKISYIFKIGEGADDPKKQTARQHAAWIALMEDGSKDSPTLTSIMKFIYHYTEDKSFAQTIEQMINDAGLKAGEFVSFRINGKNAENLQDWRDWFDVYSAALTAPKDVEKVISCISGKPVIPLSGKFPQIKTPQTGTGVPVCSNDHQYKSGNACAFHSFGENVELMCPMSQKEADTIRAALDYLMTSEDNHDRLFNMLFWYDDPETENLIQDVLSAKDEEDYERIKELLDDHNSVLDTRDALYGSGLSALRTGTGIHTGRIKYSYHVMEYTVPTKGRFYLSNYREDTYSNLKKNVKKWYEDTEVIDVVKQVPKRIMNLYQVFFGLLENKEARDKWKEIHNEFGMDMSEFLSTILCGKKIPYRFLLKASAQIEKYILTGDINAWPLPDILYIQIIKAYFIRKGDSEMENMKQLRPYTGEYKTAYHCGRVLACMDALQNAAMYQSGGVKLTIAKKYYKAFKRFPARTLAEVTENQEFYLGKIHSVTIRDKYALLLGDIMTSIGSDIPRQFTVEEQGAFDIGYFQQRADFIKEKVEASKAKNEKAQEN